MPTSASLGEAVLDLTADPTKLKKDLSQARSMATGELKNLGLGFRALGDSVVSNIGSAMRKVGKLVAVGLAAAGAAIVGFGVKGVKEFMKFQDGMNEVFTLLPGISQKAMDQMSQQVKDLSMNIGVIPEDIIPALYQALSAGVPQDNVFSFLETANKAAKGGVTDLETAVDGLSSVVNSYKASGITVSEVSDIMFTGVRLGKTTFGELSDSLANVTPLASALDVKFGDVTAALAAMTSQGTDTASATTQLRGLIQELGTSGTDASKIFQDFTGGTLKEFMDQGYSLSDALGALQQAADKTGVPINELFGNVRAGLGALQLTGPGFKTFIADIGEMQNSAGATEAAYAQMTTGISYTFDRIKAAGKVALIDIGQGLSKGLQPLAEWFLTLIQDIGPKLQPFFENLGNWLAVSIPKAVKTLKNIWSTVWPKIVAVGKPILSFVGTLVKWFQNILPKAIDFVTKHWDAFKGAIAGIAVLLAGAGIVSTLASILSIITLMANPITLLIVAAAALGAAWATDFGGIRTTLTAFWTSTLQPILMNLWQWLQVNIPIAIATVSNFWNTVLLPAIQTAWEWVQSNVFPIIQTLWAWLQQNIPIALQFLSNYWNTVLLPALQSVWGFIQGSVIPILSQVWSWLQENVPTAIQTLTDYWNNTLLPALQTVYDWWQGTLQPFLVSFSTFMRVTLLLAIRLVANIWDMRLKPALEAVWGFLNDNVVPILNDLWTIFQDHIAPVIRTFLGGVWDALTKGLETVGGWLDTIVGWLWKLIDALKNVDTKNLSAVTKNSPVPLAEGLKEVTRAAAPAIKAINSLSAASMNFGMPGELSLSAATGYSMGAVVTQAPSQTTLAPNFKINYAMTDVQIERLARQVIRKLNGR